MNKHLFNDGRKTRRAARRTAALVRAGWVFSIDAPTPTPKPPDCSWNRATPEERAEMLRKLQESCL